MIYPERHYYEVDSTTENKLPTCYIEFPDIDSAIEYAEQNGYDLICEIGGNWNEYKKCWFCEEWIDTAELNRDNLCEHCESYLISRGEI